jgi:hypothetical protein
MITNIHALAASFGSTTGLHDLPPIVTIFNRHTQVKSTTNNSHINVQHRQQSNQFMGNNPAMRKAASNKCREKVVQQKKNRQYF